MIQNNTNKSNLKKKATWLQFSNAYIDGLEVLKVTRLILTFT